VSRYRLCTWGLPERPRRGLCHRHRRPDHDALPRCYRCLPNRYHIDRGKLFVQERFRGHPVIDADVISVNIERTRFPVPDDTDHQGTADYPGLVRAADLIGQLADPQHLRKFPALFHEFEETGTNARLGFKTPDDLRRDYPTFYWKVVNRYIQDGLRYLHATLEGGEWIAHLYAHIFAVESHESLQAGSSGQV
jgi:hypothetical protein